MSHRSVLPSNKYNSKYLRNSSLKATIHLQTKQCLYLCKFKYAVVIRNKISILHCVPTAFVVSIYINMQRLYVIILKISGRYYTVAPIAAELLSNCIPTAVAMVLEYSSCDYAIRINILRKRICMFFYHFLYSDPNQKVANYSRTANIFYLK